MRALSHTHQQEADMQVVGYIDRHTGQILCVRHGVRDVESRRSSWVALRVVHRPHVGYATSAVTCDKCGIWLNGESTGYAILSAQEGHGRLRLWHTLGHRDDSAGALGGPADVGRA